MKYVDIYDEATKDLSALEDFWDKDPYEELTWGIGNSLIKKYITDQTVLLDIGCGIYPHQEFSKDYNIIGVDISFKSLQIAKKMYNDTNISYICGDSLSLPIKSSSIKYVIAVGELWNHVDPNCLLNEIERILKKDGIVIFDVSMKLCLYNIYMFLGAILGMKFAEEVDKEEAKLALKNFFKGSNITWQITPRSKSKVKLATPREVLDVVQKNSFRTLEIYGTVVISDIIPPPIQNLASKSKTIDRLLHLLQKMDSGCGNKSPFWKLGGNCFFVLQKK